MATADEYARWIVDNADKKGTPEFEVVSKAYQAARTQQKPAPQMVKVGDPGFDPTEGMSGLDKLRAGMGKAFVDLGRGAGQLTGLIDRKEIDADKRLDAPLMNTGAGVAGNVLGNVALAAPAALIPGAATIPGGAAIGAVQGALQPVGAEDSRLANMSIGGVAGGALPTVVKVAKTAKAAVVDPFTEAGRTRIAGGVLNRVAENPRQVYARLLSAKGNTTGFAPTVGQSADDAGVAALERTVRATNPQLFDSIDKGQRQALADAVRGIAKDDVARNAAVGARESAVKPLYDAAKQSQVPVDSTISALLQRPALQQAISEASTNAANRGASIGTKAVQPAATGLLDASGNPIMSQGSSGTLTGKALHEIKMALDSARDFNPIGGANKAQSGAIGDAAGDFNQWLESAIPAYGQAKSAYSTMSKPINQMDIGNEFLSKLVPSLYRDMPAPQQLNAAAYARALTDQGDDIARNVTGMGGAKLESVLDPDQLQTLRNVAADLQSMKVAENAGRGVGSDTIQKASMSHIAAESGIPNWMSSVARVPGGWMKRAGDVLYGNADDHVKSMLADLLRNPQEAAQAMQAAGVQPSKIAGILKKTAQVPAFAVPASANAAQ